MDQICAKCGNKISDGGKFCGGCGTPVQNETGVQEPAVKPARKITDNRLIIAAVLAVVCLIAAKPVLTLTGNDSVWWYNDKTLEKFMGKYFTKYELVMPSGSSDLSIQGKVEPVGVKFNRKKATTAKIMKIMELLLEKNGDFISDDSMKESIDFFVQRDYWVAGTSWPTDNGYVLNFGWDLSDDSMYRVFYSRPSAPAEHTAYGSEKDRKAIEKAVKQRFSGAKVTRVRVKFTSNTTAIITYDIKRGGASMSDQRLDASKSGNKWTVK